MHNQAVRFQETLLRRAIIDESFVTGKVFDEGSRSDGGLVWVSIGPGLGRAGGHGPRYRWLPALRGNPDDPARNHRGAAGAFL
jgi:hypothetical protein